MSIFSSKHQSTGRNPELYQLFQEEAEEILEYIQETLLELTQPIVLPSCENTNIALAIDLMCILQNDAADLDIIEVQISAYRLEILLRFIQQTQVVEINSKLKIDILEAGETLRLSLIPYLNTNQSLTASVAIETRQDLVQQDSQLTFNQTTEVELPKLLKLNELEGLEKINYVSSQLTLQTFNLMIWLAGSDIFSIPYEKIETNFIPTMEQIIEVEGQNFLQWQQQHIPIYRLSKLLNTFTLPELNPNSIRVSLFSTEIKLMLIIKQGQKLIALEYAIERLVTQPEIIIQPFDNPVSYCYGFSWWEDRSMVRVIDVAALLEQI